MRLEALLPFLRSSLARWRGTFTDDAEREAESLRRRIMDRMAEPAASQEKRFTVRYGKRDERNPSHSATTRN